MVKSITRDGTTFTAKNNIGSQLFTFTQQDNDTKINPGNGTLTLSNVKSGYTAAYSIFGSVKNIFLDAICLTQNLGANGEVQILSLPTNCRPIAHTVSALIGSNTNSVRVFPELRIWQDGTGKFRNWSAVQITNTTYFTINLTFI